MLSGAQPLPERLEVLNRRLLRIRQRQSTRPDATSRKHEMLIWNNLAALEDDMATIDFRCLRADKTNGRIEGAIEGDETPLVDVAFGSDGCTL